MEIIDMFEILTIDDYAKRLGVGKTTIFNWKNKGILVPGRHYFQRGKVVRFIWSLDLIMELHKKFENKIEETLIQKNILKNSNTNIKPLRKTVINIDY